MAEKKQEVVVAQLMKEDLKEVGGEQASGYWKGFAAPCLKVDEGVKGEALALRWVEVQQRMD